MPSAGTAARYETANVGTPEDYRQLASMAEEYRVPFDKLAEILEEHEKSPQEIRHSLDVGEISSRIWVTTKSAERTCRGIFWAAKETGVELRRKPKAGKHKQAGWLWHSEDVKRVAAIKRRGVSLREALRIFGSE